MRTAFFTQLAITFGLVTGLVPQAAKAQDAPVSYQNALRLSQEQKYADALKEFEATFSLNPQNVYNLYNWGLAAYQMDRKGLAVALWRRALYQSPDFSPAKAALDFARSQMPSDAFTPPAAGSIENLKTGFLRTIPLGNLLLLHLMLFAFLGWLIIRYLAQRKKADQAELAPPPFPFISVLFLILFVLSSALLALALQFRSELRATVVNPNAPLKTAPQTDASTVFNLLEGTEVVVQEKQKEWTLISYPGGMTGWIQSENLFQSSGS